MRMKRNMLNTISGRMVSKRKNRLTTPSNGMSSRIARTAFLLANVQNQKCKSSICYSRSVRNTRCYSRYVRNTRAIFRAQNAPIVYFISSLNSAYREVITKFRILWVQPEAPRLPYLVWVDSTFMLTLSFVMRIRIMFERNTTFTCGSECHFN